MVGFSAGRLMNFYQLHPTLFIVNLVVYRYHEKIALPIFILLDYSLFKSFVGFEAKLAQMVSNGLAYLCFVSQWIKEYLKYHFSQIINRFSFPSQQLVGSRDNFNFIGLRSIMAGFQ